MTEIYLPDDIKEQDYEIRNWKLCPLCKGHGKYYTEDPSKTEFPKLHTCENCFGIGYVMDDSHIHEWDELSRQQCLEEGIPHWGEGYHVWKCKKCKYVFNETYLRFR